MTDNINQLERIQQDILLIIKDPTLTHEQKLALLAKTSENTLDVLELPSGFEQMYEDGRICDLMEGHAPYVPRYITPDYDLFMKKGCEFLNLDPPKNLFEAINALLILYKHVPSITHFPVYLGNIDYLLEPFIEEEVYARQLIKGFLLHIDRTISDSFCHANIGPLKTKAGCMILELTEELQTSTPNLTLKYDPDLTPDDFALLAVKTSLSTAKPSFANNKMFMNDFGGDYAIASCYNGLKIGGGAYTLSRLVLKKVAETASDLDDFINSQLPSAVKTMCAYMDERIRFLIEESKFFEINFLTKEGFINRDQFTGMFGIVGLAECVNTLLQKENRQDRYGHSKYADELGVHIISVIDTMVKQHKNPYCKFSNDNFLLHGQVGISSDVGISPSVRIPIGEEPELYSHLRHAAMFHKYFVSGTGDIFPFDLSATHNPTSILDIIKGGLSIGMRYLSVYSSDSDIIRISGYLVKKSDMAKLEDGVSVQHDTVALGVGAKNNCRILERKVR